MFSLIVGPMTLLLCSASGGLAPADRRSAGSREAVVPVNGLVVAGPACPTDAETLAINRFVHEVRRIAGITLPVQYGGTPKPPSVLVGNRATLGDLLKERGYAVPPPRDGEDMARQSYVVDVLRSGSGRAAKILAAGLGQGRSGREHLGTSYALGELVRRLDLRRGKWVFVLPAEAICGVPAVAQRTLYVMNSSLRNPGLSLEHFSDEQINDYVDRLVEARFSRLCFFQWSDYYLYPGNAPHLLAEREFVHRAMRKVFERARQRGLEVYYQLSISHANPDVLPNGSELRAKGYYAPFSVCWSKPEARKLAADMARLEMEYYGPVDGYMVWFYDPGGCFCEECAAHQSERIFDQLMTVRELARTISPGASFQAALWPTWGFVREKERIGHPGRGYTEEEVREMVKDFLRRCLSAFGPRRLTIIDTCEGDESNIYNGNVKPEEFKRSGFLYTVQGMPSESAYPFALFRLKYVTEQMARAQQRGLDEAQIFIQYSATNFPSVYAFADALYTSKPAYEGVLDRLTATLAKGEARRPLREFFEAVEALSVANSLDAARAVVGQMQEAARRTLTVRGYVGDPDWLRGYVLAQRHYVELAGAEGDAAFQATLARFREELAAIPMYRDYARRALQPDIVRGHIRGFWGHIATVK